MTDFKNTKTISRKTTMTARIKLEEIEIEKCPDCLNKDIATNDSFTRGTH